MAPLSNTIARWLCSLKRPVVRLCRKLGFESSAFDNGERDLEGGAGHVAASFLYLNRSVRAEAAAIRDKIDDLLCCYPRSRRQELVTRIRSPNEAQHQSAVFELVLHELLMRSGCRVLAVEPAVAGSERRPDFLVSGLDGEMFYLEAVVATGLAQADAGGERRLQDALDAINDIETPDFLLELRYGGIPAQPIRRNRLQNAIREWLAGLDYDAVKAKWDAGNVDDLPKLKLDEFGARFEMEPIPRTDTRGDLGRGSLGIYGPIDVMMVAPHDSIRAAVKRKAGRYGDLPLPYIIAVNALAPFAEERHSIEALVGTEGLRSYRGADGNLVTEVVRNADGVWNEGGQPRYTRVSAVISMDRLTAWRLGQVPSRIILNPYARRPLRTLLPLTQWAANGNSLQRNEGQIVSEVLGLPNGWPGPNGPT